MPAFAGMTIALSVIRTENENWPHYEVNGEVYRLCAHRIEFGELAVLELEGVGG